MAVNKYDEAHLIKFLLKAPSTGSAEDIFNLWNKVYDTSKFTMNDISYILNMIEMYKDIRLSKDIKDALFENNNDK